MKALTVETLVRNSAKLIDVPEPPIQEGSIVLEMVAIGICGTDIDIINGDYGWPVPGSRDLIIGHESLGRVIEAPPGCGLVVGDLAMGIVRRPDPEPCANCAIGEWDMCRNGNYTERGIKGRNGYCSERFRIEPEFAVKVDSRLGQLGVLIEPASVVAKAWEQIYRIGTRATFAPKRVLVMGAGPIGLLAALLGRQKGLEIHVLDQMKEGPKPDLVRELGGIYHSDISELKALAGKIDVVLECTGVPQLFFEGTSLLASDGILCLTGVSSGAREIKIDMGTLDRSIVLGNQVIFGSVNAAKRHYTQAMHALVEADPKWLERLISRRIPLTRWQEALMKKTDDIKTIIIQDR
jgi:threonine dehydrogenase-like Zn-dependent dehydrogenase